MIALFLWLSVRVSCADAFLATLAIKLGAVFGEFTVNKLRSDPVALRAFGCERGAHFLTQEPTQ